MRKFTTTSFLIFAFIQITTAQTKLLTMEDAIIKQKTTLAPAKLKQLMWVKGTNTFSYVDTKDSTDLLMIGNAESGKQPPQTAATLMQLNDALKTLNFNSLKIFPQILWKNVNQFTFETEKKLLAY